MQEYQVKVIYRGTYANNDVGYATITTSPDMPTYTNSKQGHFMNISGIKDNADYKSDLIVGGNKYYLHLGYKKDYGTDSYEDRIVINSIKIYELKDIVFGFESKNGKYMSNNKLQANTTANSYIPINLQDLQGQYDLVVNAEISSQSNGDYGYAIVTQTPDMVEYDDEDDNLQSNLLINISGECAAKDYKMTLDGGNQYYLHLGYYKNSRGDEGKDTFTINKITIGDSTYRMFTTDLDGKIEVTLPKGEYEIEEIEAPEGYKIKDGQLQGVTINKDTKGVIEISKINEKEPCIVRVHHYVWDKINDVATTQLVRLSNGQKAEEKEIIGLVGDIYGTEQIPEENLKKGYKLYKEPEGNAYGLMTQKPIDVYYYYIIEDGQIISSNVTKEGTQLITSKDEEINYKIKYAAKVDNYEESAIVTITDTLPYALDLDKMQENERNRLQGELPENWLENVLDGGQYKQTSDEEGNTVYTIEWIENINEINKVNTEGTENVSIEKNIKLVYKNIDLKGKSFDNTVEANIYLEKTEQIQDTEPEIHTTKINFVKYIKVTKTWEHGANIYEKPTQLKIKIKNANTPDAPAVEETTISEENGWTHTFTNLPKYDAETGEEIEYVVEEEAVEGEEELFKYYEKK